MAERYAARDEAPLVIHPTEASIHEHFNKIIYRLNQRREEVIAWKERRAAKTTRLNTVQQLIDTKTEVQTRMKENLIHSIREKMLEDIDTRMTQLQVVSFCIHHYYPNDRIVVMDTDLKHKRYIKHQTMTYPRDVKVNNNKVYILSIQDSPCLHVFSLTGENIRSLIIRDYEGNAQVRQCYSFCFDKKQNILMSDYQAGNIKVFSQEGALLHRLGGTHRIETRPSYLSG